MGKNRWQSWSLFVVTGLWVAACGGSSKNQDSPKTGDKCEPGALSCDGLNVKVCDADGVTLSIEKTCLPDQACVAGACTDSACVPNTKFCKDGQVHKCDRTGSGSTLSKTCGTNQFCLEADEDADCSDTACKAGQALCDGQIATVCKPDGSGPAPEGKSCADSKQVCFEGACTDQTCMPNQKLCQDGDVYLCGANSKDTSLVVECGTSEVCDGTTAACRPKQCEPKALSCSGNKVVTCNDFGSDWAPGGVDCAATDEICVAGACKKQICTPGATFCQDGNVYACDSQGLTSYLNQSCSPSSYYHCQQYETNYAYCANNQCYAGQAVCDGNVLKTCTPEGNLPTTGTACGTDKICTNGACATKICEPYTTYCKDGDIYYCDYDGTFANLQQQCLSGTACKETPYSITCEPLPCSPGETACIANKVGVCAQDGASLGSTTQDCYATDTICSAEGTCLTSVVDTLGVAEDATTVSGGTVMGNAVSVLSARTVTQLEANLVLASPRELRWVIYEQSGSNWVARVDKVVANQSGTGFFSSGAFNYALKAGKNYLFAVAISGGNSIVYYDTAPYPLDQSFGHVLGGVSTYYASSFGVDYYYYGTLYQMRITTGLP